MAENRILRGSLDSCFGTFFDGHCQFAVCRLWAISLVRGKRDFPSLNTSFDWKCVKLQIVGTMIITKMDVELEGGVKLGAAAEDAVVARHLETEVSLVEKKDWSRFYAGLEKEQGPGSNDSLISEEITLEHSRTAPPIVNAFSDLFVGSPQLVLLRSKTERKESSRHDLQIDRLPDAEKRKLFENPVKVHQDGKVEVDMSKRASVVTELLELDVLTPSLTIWKILVLESGNLCRD